MTKGHCCEFHRTGGNGFASCGGDVVTSNLRPVYFPGCNRESGTAYTEKEVKSLLLGHRLQCESCMGFHVLQRINKARMRVFDTQRKLRNQRRRLAKAMQVAR
jgi:hypothetical protein